MYDDYDLEYSFSNENILDEDMLYEMYHGVHNVMDENDDDDYARDNDTYEALAYRHYAWYNTYTLTRIMHAHTLTQKRLVRVTLDIMCYDDLDVQSIDWNDTLGLEGDESVDADIKDYSEIF